MNLPVLTPRLLTVAKMVRQGSVAADVGTDHALLPVWLTLSGRCPKALACDLRPGPLARAAETVGRFGAGERVSLLLSDGLDAVGYADDVVIAGMGGELIARIISRCGFIRDKRVSLVLQPMTALPELRDFLCRAGFSILEEAAVREGEKLYVVQRAVYAGTPFEPDEFFLLTGRLPELTDETARAVLLREAGRLRHKAQGLRLSRGRSGEAGAAEEMARRIEEAAGPKGADDDNR